MQKLYDDFRLNVLEYPALAEILADQLGVSAEALNRLGVGFDPTTGTWIFPEFDEGRTLIGMLRRYPEGRKYCVEGSKRGLSLDPQHELVYDVPVIVVEGPTDTAAALTLGCQAIGRPSATHGFDKIKAMTEGHTVLIVGENDGGVGVTSVSGLLLQLKDICKSVSSVLPPPDYKDLRQWVQSGTLTKDELEGYCDGGSVKDTQILELKYPEIRAIDLAEHWLRANYWRGTIPLLRNYRGDWYTFRTSCYELADEDEVLTSSIHQHYRHVMVSKPNTKGTGVEVKPVDISSNRLRSIKQSLLATCAVPTSPPCWFGFNATDVSKLVVFQNGYLDTTDWTFHSPTPELFVVATVPYNYDPAAKCKRWLRFLEEIFPNDPLKHKLLQEWLGYLLVADTSHEKFMLFHGLPGTGKGTAISTMMSVLGDGLTVAFSMEDIGYQFGLHKLVGKLAAFAGDAHITHHTDAIRVVELIKAITGQDAVAVNRKFHDETTKLLTTRLTVSVNDLPELPDDAGALQRRLLVLSFPTSFTANPDTKLKKTLKKEIAGICVWGLEGLKRLQANGQFTEPASMKCILKEIGHLNSPIRAFIAECCNVQAGAETPFSAIYACWRGYSKENRLAPVIMAKFETRLRLAMPEIMPRALDDGSIVYQGVALRPDAETRYVRF